MTRPQAIRRVFAAWLANIPTLLLLTIQSAAGRYGEDYAYAWAWFMSLVVPAAALFGATLFSAPTAHWKRAPADMFRYRLALGGTIAQALLIFLCVVAEPWFGMSPFRLFDVTIIGLNLVNGIVLGALGALLLDGR